jgi:hypothetical protein
MGRAPDPLSVRYERHANALVERAVRRAGQRRVSMRWAVGIVERPPGVSWERVELAFNRALYRSPLIYHRSDQRTHSLKKPVWFAPVGRVREVRIRVFPVRSAYRYIQDHPGAGMRLGK